MPPATIPLKSGRNLLKYLKLAKWNDPERPDFKDVANFHGTNQNNVWNQAKNALNRSYSVRKAQRYLVLYKATKPKRRAPGDHAARITEIEDVSDASSDATDDDDDMHPVVPNQPTQPTQPPKKRKNPGRAPRPGRGKRDSVDDEDAGDGDYVDDDSHEARNHDGYDGDGSNDGNDEEDRDDYDSEEEAAARWRDAYYDPEDPYLWIDTIPNNDIVLVDMALRAGAPPIEDTAGLAESWFKRLYPEPRETLPPRVNKRRYV